jgi:ABC-type uncharacterized transport system permease subunit
MAPGICIVFRGNVISIGGEGQMIVGAILVYILLWRTTLGYRIRSVALVWPFKAHVLFCLGNGGNE